MVVFTFGKTLQKMRIITQLQATFIYQILIQKSGMKKVHFEVMAIITILILISVRFFNLEIKQSIIKNTI